MKRESGHLKELGYVTLIRMSVHNLATLTARTLQDGRTADDGIHKTLPDGFLSVIGERDHVHYGDDIPTTAERIDMLERLHGLVANELTALYREATPQTHAAIAHRRRFEATLLDRANRAMLD